MPFLASSFSCDAALRTPSRKSENLRPLDASRAGIERSLAYARGNLDQEVSAKKANPTDWVRRAESRHCAGRIRRAFASTRRLGPAFRFPRKVAPGAGACVSLSPGRRWATARGAGGCPRSLRAATFQPPHIFSARAECGPG